MQQYLRLRTLRVMDDAHCDSPLAANRHELLPIDLIVRGFSPFSVRRPPLMPVFMFHHSNSFLVLFPPSAVFSFVSGPTLSPLS